MLNDGFHKLHGQASVEIPDIMVCANPCFDACAPPLNNGTSIERQLKGLSSKTVHDEH
jgi:hypothetical protein